MTVKCVRVAQWIRRPPTKREIAGSSPVVDFLFFLMHRDVSRNPGFESQSPPSFLTLFHNKLSYTWISTVYCFIHFIPIIYSSYAAWYLYDSNSFCVLTKYPTCSIHNTYLNPFYMGCIASRWVRATSLDASQWDASLSPHACRRDTYCVQRSSSYWKTKALFCHNDPNITVSTLQVKRPRTQSHWALYPAYWQ